MTNRWWLYQQERFPIFCHGLLIAAVCFGALVYSLRIRGHFELPDVSALGVAFVSTFVFFLQLRIAMSSKTMMMISLTGRIVRCNAVWCVFRN